MISLLHNYMLAMSHLEDYLIIFPPYLNYYRLEYLHRLNGLLSTPQIVKCLVNLSHLKSRNNVQHKKLQIKIKLVLTC